MTRLVLGVIGHVDHGKTALVRALTGQDTDRLPEEKERGISIALGFAHLQLGPDTTVDFIDMPGHERFVRTMVSGATGIDAVLLVVAANEGIKPQTVEHVDIAALLGVRRAIVAISKSDLVIHEQAAVVAEEAMQLLAKADIDALPPVMTSVVAASGFDELRQALLTLSTKQIPHAVDGLAFLPIDRAFAMTGHGPVVTGTLRGSAICATDVLELLPLRRKIRIRGIQVSGVPVASAAPGQRVALNLRDVETGELNRGMVLAAPDALVPSSWLTMAIRAVVAGGASLRNGMRLRALLGTHELDVRLRLLDRDVLDAGERGFAQLHCAEPVAIPTGEHVILRLPSPPQTVAGGRILESEARRQRRHAPEILQRLQELSTLLPTEMMAAEVRRAGLKGTTVKQLSQLCALTPSRVIHLLAPLPLVVTAAGLVVGAAELDALLTRIASLLTAQATGLSHDRLLAALPGTGVAVLNEALGRLVARGIICERGKRFFIPKPDEDLARARDASELAAQIAGLLQRSGLTPPNPGDIISSAAAKRAVDRLLREGVVVRAVDRAKGREMLFHRDAIVEAQRRLAPLLEQPPGLLVTEIAAALGISRKFCMPLLDHLDTIRFTRRIGDRRVRI